MIFILLLITILTLSYVWIKWRYSYWKKRGVPGPEPTFPFGNIKESTLLSEHIGLLCEKWYKEFLDVPYIGFYKMTEPAIMLRDPDLIKDVIVTDFSSFDQNFYAINKNVDEILTVNPVFCSGAAWKQNRAIILPPFASHKIKFFVRNMETSSSKMIDYLSNLPKNQDIDAISLTSKYAIQNVVQCVFSIDAKCFETEDSDFHTNIRDIFAPTFLVAQAIPKWLVNILPISVLSFKSNNWFRKVIKENKASRKNGMKCNDVMQFLLDIQEKNDMTETELMGHGFSLMLDGTMTSGTSLAFVLYELARHSDCQQKTYEEIKEVLERHDNKLTWEALLEMKYLKMVISESMRLNSALLTSGKVCTKPYTLPKLSNQKEAFTIPVGMTVTIPYKALHYCDHYPNPEEFIPERFSDEERKNRHIAVYLPFGEGPRTCPGMKFAFTQISVALVHLLQNFVVTLSPNHKPFKHDVKSLMWSAKDGLLLNFELHTQK